MAGRFFLMVVLVLSVGASVFGQNYFIYIQSENKEPFYVKWQARTISSSASGYVLIPKVPAGDHSMQIGFNSDSWLLKRFNFRMTGRDAGFMLKKSGDDNWVLYNLQTAETVMAEAGPAPAPVYPRSDDAFVNILADVVEMPSLNKPEPKPKAGDSSVVANKKDTGSKVVPVAVINKSGPGDTVARLIPEVQGNQIAENRQPDKKPAVVSGKKDVVTPQKEKSSAVKADSVKMDKKPLAAGQNDGMVANGKITSPYPVDSGRAGAREIRVVNNYLYKNERLMLFHVSDGFMRDTVDILMEYSGKRDKEKKKAEKKSKQKEESSVISEGKPVIEEPEAEGQKPSVATVAAVVPETVSFIFCKDSASADDFLKLRKRMAAENSEDAMLERAGKVFRSKCFTVNQVRNLSYLFMDEEKKLLFLESSYPCVPDKANFGTLENLLTDPARIGRLRNLYRPKK